MVSLYALHWLFAQHVNSSIPQSGYRKLQPEMQRDKYTVLTRECNSVLCVFFWVIPRRLNFIYRRFGTLTVPSSYAGSYLPAYQDGTDSVPKAR